MTSNRKIPVVQGWDLSLNHAGFVELDYEGQMTWFGYVWDKAKHVKAKHNGTHLKLAKGDDTSKFRMDRLRWWNTHFAEMLGEWRPNITHVGIEDYAISPASRGGSNTAYQIGELGGAARLAVLSAGIALRLHDPMSVKMFGAHNGGATPQEVTEAVMERFPGTAAWVELDEGPRLDLAAAYVVARMVLVEVWLRSGEAQLSELHEKEVQVFNRITKAYPVNLLAREFIAP